MTSALTIGLPVSIPLVAYGGTPPYTYSIASGLPAGLSLNAATGLVTGTPTTVQSSTALEWSVEDSATPTPGTATDTFLVVVQAVPVAVPFYSFPVASAGRWRLRGAFKVIPPEVVDVAITGQPMTMAAVLESPDTVDVAIVGSPMTMAAVLESPDTVDVSITGQPMTMAAVVAFATVDVSIIGQPMTMAAVLEIPATIEVAITGSPMTMAAVVEQQSIDVAIVGSPMTMAAVLTQPATVDVAIVGQPMTMAAVLVGFSRTTEDGDTRTTEAGNTRTTEDQ